MVLRYRPLEQLAARERLLRVPHHRIPEDNAKEIVFDLVSKMRDLHSEAARLHFMKKMEKMLFRVIVHVGLMRNTFESHQTGLGFLIICSPDRKRIL